MTYIEPCLTVLLIILFFAWLLCRRTPGSSLVMAGLIGLFLLSWPVTDWLFSRPLEIWYPVRPVGFPAQAIVVFSSAVEPPLPERPYSLPDEQTYRRCEYAAWLYHHWQAVPILASGGSGRRGEPFSWAMRSLLEESGVPADQIWIEDRSHSTHENSVFSGRILQQRGITAVALIVDATSMPRAAACLRKEGLRVVPAPSEFREWGPLPEELLPSWKAIRHNEATLHEIGGLAWYWLRGWI